jgi:alpha-beta hydrolase superfamily lysophospholipase
VTSSPTRQDVEIRSGDDAVAAWFYPAAGAADRAPCVVMSHGFSLTRSDGLAPYAEAFAATGSHVLVFDPRYLGDSGGLPRQRFRIEAQRQDWLAVVQHARQRPDVDSDRVSAWAYSFAGGIVADLLTRGRLDVRTAMLLCPMLDGLRRARAAPTRDVLRVLPYAARDRLGSHVMVPVTAEPGLLGAMTLPGEAQGFAASVPPDSRWRNEISPGVLLSLPFFRPAGRAGRIGVPLWLGRCADDITVDGDAIASTAAAAPHGELHDFTGAHFAPFTGEVTSEVVAAQLAFWSREG